MRAKDRGCAGSTCSPSQKPHTTMQMSSSMAIFNRVETEDKLGASGLKKNGGLCSPVLNKLRKVSHTSRIIENQHSMSAGPSDKNEKGFGTGRVFS